MTCEGDGLTEKTAKLNDHKFTIVIIVHAPVPSVVLPLYFVNLLADNETAAHF